MSKAMTMSARLKVSCTRYVCVKRALSSGIKLFTKVARSLLPPCNSACNFTQQLLGQTLTLNLASAHAFVGKTTDHARTHSLYLSVLQLSCTVVKPRVDLCSPVSFVRTVRSLGVKRMATCCDKKLGNDIAAADLLRVG